MLPKLSLPTISVPKELQSSLKRVLDGHPKKKLVADGRVLYKYLISRKTVTRVQESRRRRGLLRTVPVKLWSEKKNSSSKETVESVLRYGSREAVAYAASRLNATYGSTLRVLNEIAVRDPKFRPDTMLDFGSGLGTAVWAAHNLWRESLYEVQTVDTSGEMGEMARQLRLREEEEGEEKEEEGEEEGEEKEEGEEGRGRETVPGVYFRQYLPTSNRVQYDLVTSCYTLGDLPSLSIKKLSLTALWRKTKNYLVLVELGNNTGFQNIVEARDMILDAPNWISKDSPSSSTDPDTEDTLEGHVFAPCPHSHRCPLMTAATATTTEEGVTMATVGGPCRFGQRVALDLSNREILKHKGHNIETFSYVILKKGRQDSSNEQQYSRLLAPVKKRSKHVLTQQCCPDGVARQVTYTKSKHGNMYRVGREGDWGDRLPYNQVDTDNNLNTHYPQTNTDPLQTLS